MKKLLALFLFLLLPVYAHAQVPIPSTFFGAAAAVGGTNGFTAVKTITIDHTKVGSSDHTDFPMVFSGTYTYLKTTGNGGDVTSAGAFDIIFYTNSNCTGTTLAPEIDYYVASTGAITLWVRVPSVSHTVDTVIYLCYGKASITTQQGTPSSNWDGNFLAVYHAGDASTISLADSTANARTLTNTSTTASSGKIRGGFSFNGSTKFVKNTAIPSPASVTLNWWQSAPAQSGEPYAVVIGSAVSPSVRILSHAPYTDGTLYWDFGNATDNNGRVSTGYKAYYSAWTMITLVYNNSTTDHKIYLNGAEIVTNAHSNSQSLGNGLYIAHCDISPDCDTFGYAQMELDEFQYSNSARGPDWITATYNNQNSPSTFYTIS